MYTHQPKYRNQSIQSDIDSGKIKPNLEAKARVERSRNQEAMFKKHRDFIFEQRGIKTMALFPKYSHRVINRIHNFLTTNKNAKNVANVL